MYRIYCDGVYREATPEEMAEAGRLAPPAGGDSVASLREELALLRQKLDRLAKEGE